MGWNSVLGVDGDFFVTGFQNPLLASLIPERAERLGEALQAFLPLYACGPLRFPVWVGPPPLSLNTRSESNAIVAPSRLATYDVPFRNQIGPASLFVARQSHLN